MKENIFVRKEDWFEIELASILTDYDRKTIDLLYQPLVGYGAIALFHTLWSTYENDEYDLLSHEKILNFMRMSTSEFQKAREQLEAVGLMRTFFKEENGVRYFKYVLYAPKMPNDFFQDILFAGLYEKYLGKKDAEMMASRYALKKNEKRDGKEISASFNEIFHPDLDDECFSLASTKNKKAKKRKTRMVQGSFDFGTFFQIFEDKFLMKAEKLFSKSDLNEIERVATLMGIDEETMVTIVYRTYQLSSDGKGEFVLDDLIRYAKEELRFPSMGKSAKQKSSEVSSSSRIAEKIRLFESMSPYDFLKVKQNMTEPVPSDIALIDRLSSRLHLVPSVINVLVDYVLQVKDNTLPAAFTEKIGASLARAQIDNALDAMNFLIKPRRKNSVLPSKEIEKEQEEKEEVKKDEDSDAEWEEFLKKTY